MPQWRYRVHTWEDAGGAVYTQTGWITQERRIAPVNRIQTVDTQRGPIEQLFKLSNVTVTTASAAGPLKIHGLDRDDRRPAGGDPHPAHPAERGRRDVSRPADVPGADGWRRLSPRMLLIHPVVELGKSFPLLIGALFAGSNTGAGEYWGLGVAVIVIGLAISRWFTTRYRIDAEQIQLRRGLLRRQTVNARLDRVRTVDVTSHLLHRALGLARVTIGTGTSDRRRHEGLTLDGVDVDAAQHLRAELLHNQPFDADPDDRPPGLRTGPGRLRSPVGPLRSVQPVGCDHRAGRRGFRGAHRERRPRRPRTGRPGPLRRARPQLDVDSRPSSSSDFSSSWSSSR